MNTFNHASYHFEKRWALMAKLEYRWELLGKYCWPDATPGEPEVRTFRTRKLTRQAKKQLGSYRHESRIVKVTLRVS